MAESASVIEYTANLDGTREGHENKAVNRFHLECPLSADSSNGDDHD